IVRADCRKVRDLLLRLPTNATKRFPKLTLQKIATIADQGGLDRLHPTTVHNYLNWLTAIFNWADQEEHADRNPAAALGVRSSASERKSGLEPFTIDQLNTIFRGPLYTGCKDDGARYADPGPNRPRRGRFWVPLLSLWEGTRLNECCQLHVDDIRVLDGTECI